MKIYSSEIAGSASGGAAFNLSCDQLHAQHKRLVFAEFIVLSYAGPGSTAWVTAALIPADTGKGIDLLNGPCINGRQSWQGDLMPDDDYRLYAIAYNSGTGSRVIFRWGVAEPGEQSWGSGSNVKDIIHTLPAGETEFVTATSTSPGTTVMLAPDPYWTYEVLEAYCYHNDGAGNHTINLGWYNARTATAYLRAGVVAAQNIPVPFMLTNNSPIITLTQYSHLIATSTEAMPGVTVLTWVAVVRKYGHYV